MRQDSYSGTLEANQGILPGPRCYGDRLGPGLILRDCIVHFLVQVCVCVCVSLHYQSPAG